MFYDLISIINNLFNTFNSFAKSSPIIAGAISLWGLGVISYFGRNIPINIWRVIVKQTTTTMILLSSSQAYHNFIVWFHEQGYTRSARNLKVSSGRWGDDIAVKGIGYGTHYFMYKWYPFRVQITKIDNTSTNMERDELTITVLGRSHKFFDIIFEQIRKSIKKKDKIQVFKFTREYWQKVVDQTIRNINTVFTEDSIITDLTTHIDTFIEKEKWYMDHGLSYQTGILLYGEPGCGKTSLIKAIATKYNKELYILNASSLGYIHKAIMDLPDNCILLVEDIDAEPATHHRKYKSDEPVEKTDYLNDALDELRLTNLSDILNALDGIISVHGRILIATTNHLEQLDDALVRNGRFDLKLKLSYATNNIVHKFFNKYYPEFVIPDDFNIKQEVSPAKIQALILKNLNTPEKVLEELRS